MSVTTVVDELTKEITAGCFRLRLLTRFANHLSNTDYQQLARGMAFLTLAKYYDADALPDQVPPHVVRHGVKLMSDELTGRGSDYYDRRMRGAINKAEPRRRDVHSLLTSKWTLYQTHFGSSFRESPEWWTDRMLEILRTKLPIKQWELLEAVYLKQTPRLELAEQLVAAEPRKYSDSNALPRAVAALDTRLSRARSAARTLLGKEFAARAEEVSVA